MEEPTLPPAPVRAARPPSSYKRYIDLGASLPAPLAYGSLGITSTAKVGAPTSLESSVSGAVGLSSSVWLDGSSGSFKLAPELGYHSPSLGLNTMLVEASAVDLYATAHVIFVSEDHRPVEQVEPGLGTVLRLANKLRVDGGLYLAVNPGPTTTFGVRVPAAVGFQITDHVYAALNSGVSVSNLADTRGTTAIPMGVTFGWSDKLSSGQSVGVSPSISLPELIKPGAQEVFQPGKAVFGVSVFFVSKL